MANIITFDDIKNCVYSVSLLFIKNLKIVRLMLKVYQLTRYTYLSVGII